MSHHIELCSGKLGSLWAHFVLRVASVLQEAPNITQPHFNFLPGIHTVIYHEDVGCSFSSKKLQYRSVKLNKWLPLRRGRNRKKNLGPSRLSRGTLFGVGFWVFLVLFPLVLFCFFLDQQSEALAATRVPFTWICRETQPGPTQAFR